MTTTAQWNNEWVLNGDDPEWETKMHVAGLHGVDILDVTQAMMEDFYRAQREDADALAWEKTLAPATSTGGAYKIYGGGR